MDEIGPAVQKSTAAACPSSLLASPRKRSERIRALPRSGTLRRDLLGRVGSPMGARGRHRTKVSAAAVG